MWIYWTLFLWPALAAVVVTCPTASTSKLAMWFFAIFLTLIIGLRFEVGVDWGSYLRLLGEADGLTWLEYVWGRDLAYASLNWVTMSTGSGIWLVNLVCAIVFVSGFFVFCRRLPNPWLAMTVGMPMMVIVVAMAATRQSAAIGLVLWAFVGLQDGRIRRFVIFIVMAMLFHKSAVLLLPLGVLGSIRNRFWTFVWIGIASVLISLAFAAEYFEGQAATYFRIQMDSRGAGIRVAMNVVPAFIFLAMRRCFKLQPSQRSVWTWLSIIALLFIPALVLSPSSTVVDRVALYFIPIQLLVFSHLPVVVGPRQLRRFVTFLVVAGYALVMFVWFNATIYYPYFVPYKFYPLEVL